MGGGDGNLKKTHCHGVGAKAAKQWDSVRWLLAQFYRMDAQTATSQESCLAGLESWRRESGPDSLPSPQLGLAASTGNY